MQRSYLPAVIVMIAMLLTAFTVSGSNRSQVGKGRYIATGVAACAGCHTPVLPSGVRSEFSGAPIRSRPTANIAHWASHAPNLTPGGPLRRWTDTQIAEFLMTGSMPSGKRARSPMPRYRLDEGDATAVTAYLRSLPPVK